MTHRKNKGKHSLSWRVLFSVKREGGITEVLPYRRENCLCCLLYREQTDEDIFDFTLL